MKKLILKIVLLFSTILIDICICITSAILSLDLDGLYTEYGIFWSALYENGFRFPFIINNILLIVAAFSLVVEYFDKYFKEFFEFGKDA
jgi:hypothetical protein